VRKRGIWIAAGIEIEEDGTGDMAGGVLAASIAAAPRQIPGAIEHA
jgi:hypothetical protein